MCGDNLVNVQYLQLLVVEIERYYHCQRRCCFVGKPHDVIVLFYFYMYLHARYMHAPHLISNYRLAKLLLHYEYLIAQLKNARPDQANLKSSGFNGYFPVNYHLIEILQCQRFIRYPLCAVDGEIKLFPAQ